MEVESAYERAADELETNQVDKATWARAFADSDGDTQKTKARYIALRVKKLTGEVQAQGAPITANQPQAEVVGQGAASDSDGKLETEAERKARLWKEAQELENGHRLGGVPPSKITPQASHPDQVKQTPKANDSPHTSGAGVTDLYEAVIGEKNASYYLRKFAQFDQQGPGLKASWNWPAFLVGGAWTLYRKMYGWFFVFLAAFVLWNLSGRGTFIDLAFFAFAVAFAVFANSLYHRHVTNKISNSKLATGAYQVQLNHLHDVGGIHAWVVWVAVGIPFVGILAAIVIPGQQPSTTARISSHQTTSNPNVPVDASTSAPAVSTQYANTEGSRWVLLERSDNMTVYADPSSIVKMGNGVAMWSLFDNAPGVAIEFLGKPVMSFMQLAVFDCNSGRYQIQGNRFYSNNMGQGTVVDQKFDTWEWYEVTGLDESRWKYACGR